MPINDYDLGRLAQFELFAETTRNDLLKLIDGGRVLVHHHRQTFVEMGDQADVFGIVLEGAYKLLKPTPRGDDFIVYFATPGDAVGALLMGQGPNVRYPISVRSLGFSRMIAIPKATFKNHWKSNASMLLRINSLLFTRLGFLQDEKVLTRAPLFQRIAWFLVKMLERNIDGDVPVIPVPLTRQEIADHLGVSVESVIRIMSQWTQQGILKSYEGQLQIVRLDSLVEIIKEIE